MREGLVGERRGVVALEPRCDHAPLVRVAVSSKDRVDHERMSDRAEKLRGHVVCGLLSNVTACALVVVQRRESCREGCRRGCRQRWRERWCERWRER